MTREIIPGTKGKSFQEQQAILASFSTGIIQYRTPSLKEAAVAILTEHAATGTRLFNAGTCTRCQEDVGGLYTAIGDFVAAGIDIRIHYAETEESVGLAGCWEL